MLFFFKKKTSHLFSGDNCGFSIVIFFNSGLYCQVYDIFAILLQIKTSKYHIPTSLRFRFHILSWTCEDNLFLFVLAVLLLSYFYISCVFCFCIYSNSNSEKGFLYHERKNMLPCISLKGETHAEDVLQKLI
jgi:hypothetical protein